MSVHKEEEIAKNYIETFLPELCNKGNFIIVDDLNDENNKAPDLQNELDDIGIEVTIAVPQEEMRVKNTAFLKTSDEEFPNTISDDAWSEPHITKSGHRFLMGKYSSPDIYFNKQIKPLCEAVDKKLNKLNTTTNRKYFSNNGLFICNEMPLKNNERIEEIYNLIFKAQNEYQKAHPAHKIFDFVIISAQTIPDLMCYFDMHNKLNNRTIKRQ